jgi:hypothetical protein
MAFNKYISIFLLSLVIFALSCGGNANSAAQKHHLSRINQVRQTINPAMQLTFLEPVNEDYMEIYEIARKQKPLTALLDDITDRLNLSEPIQVYFDECDESNAFYNPETREITFCYELLYDMVAIQDDTVSMDVKISRATSFTLLHELGHALIDQLEIPVTGKEENAADEVAMILMLTSPKDETLDAAFEGALQFYDDALDEDLKKYPFYDVHAPSIERFNDMMTLYIGAFPDDSEHLIGDNEDYKLSPERAASAPDEFDQKVRTWQKLLQKYLKQPLIEM